ncbi:hypothetical protein LUZ60_014125 [Juncus effusus]|nr:hypothetical protein LUZ60_014125 [Juncus effusus]
MRAAQPDIMAAVEKYSMHEFATFPVVRGKPVKEDSHTPLVDFDWHCLYEIFDMKISHVNAQDSVEVHGKILLHCSSGFMFLFNRREGNSETINLPGAITLMTPTIGINGSDRIGIMFELEGDLKELNEKFVGWTPDDHPLDILWTNEVKGRNCSLALRYIVFEEALLANIEIKLLTGDGKGKATIYGNVTASFTEMTGLEFELFKKKCDDSIIVSEEELIPLSKSLISVPFASELDIKVNLSNAIAIVRFMPESLGEYIGIISDQIEVKVTFWSFRSHLRINKPKPHFHEYSEFLEHHS